MDFQSVTIGPRSQQKRGPQAAEPCAHKSLATRRKPMPAGGFSSTEASRHLIDRHRHSGPGGEDDLYYNATRAIVVAARRWRKLANERVKAVGQTMARWETLFLVAFSAEELTQSELARLISVEGPTMVRMLDLLAREGLIERRQSESDRRVTINRITPEGLKVITEIMGITNGLRHEVLGDIEPGRLATCVSVLEEILGKLDTLR